MPPQLPVPPLTPPTLPRAARGYQRKATDEFVEALASHYEAVWLERKHLLEEVGWLKAALADYEALQQEAEALRRSLDDQAKRQQLVTGAIYSAERFAEAIKEEARRDAELALKKARERAEEIVGDARRDRVRIGGETERLQELGRQMRSDLMSTLASVLDDLQPERPPKAEADRLPPAPAPDEQQTAGSSRTGRLKFG